MSSDGYVSRMALDEEIRSLIESSGAQRVGVAYRGLDSPDEVMIDADESFHAASTFKVCVMMELFRQAEAGLLKLEDQIEIRNEFQSIVDGSPYSLSIEDDSETSLYGRIGEAELLVNLCRPMITHSSNLATNLLVDRLKATNITACMWDLGAYGVVVRRGVEDGPAYRQGLNNTVTARSLTAIMFRLANFTLRASGNMIDILADQQHRNCIPAKLPLGARVWNKTGWNSGICHDTAAVLHHRGLSYVLTVLTEGLDEKTTGPDLIASISELIYGKYN